MDRPVIEVRHRLIPQMVYYYRDRQPPDWLMKVAYSEIPVVFENPDKTYQKGSKTVARVDLTLSYLTLIFAVCMFIVVVKTGNFQIPLLDICDHQDAFYGVRIVTELVSIPIAAKLLKGTSESSKRQDPKGSAYWCNVWLMSCAIWILFNISEITLVAYLGQRGEFPEFLYMKLVTLVFIIVLRLGAINAVGVYRNELDTYYRQNANAFTA